MTANDIFATSLLVSLPTDWLGCVSNLLNNPSTPSISIVNTLKAESLRRKSHQTSEVIDLTSASAKEVPQSSPTGVKRGPCKFCKRTNHSTDNCWSLRDLMKDHSVLVKDHLEATLPSSLKSKSSKLSKGKSVKPEKVSRTSVVTDDESSSEDKHTSSAMVVTESTSAVSSPCWTMDSGTTTSMAPNQSYLQPLSITSCDSKVRLADGLIIKAAGSGSALVPLLKGSHSALIVPSLREPLLSISAFCDDGMSVVFTKSNAHLYASHQLHIDASPIATAPREGNLYYLSPGQVKPPSHTSGASYHLPTTDDSLMSWHCRLGHPNLRVVKKLLKSLDIPCGLANDEDVSRCPVCVQGKWNRPGFHSRGAFRARCVGEIIHLDVSSFPTPSREGYKYYFSFIDDFSKFSTAYLLKSKDQTFTCFKHFLAHFETQTGSHMKSFRSDNGGEFISKEFGAFLASRGISHTPGPPHTPQLNGFAERWNRTVGDRVRCLLISADMPDRFWGDAIRYINHIFNSLPCSTSSGFKIPTVLANMKSVAVKDSHPFGCRAWYRVPDALRSKLEPKARQEVLLSYQSDGNGFVVWDLVFVSRSGLVMFCSKTPSFRSSLSRPQLHPLPRLRLKSHAHRYLRSLLLTHPYRLPSTLQNLRRLIYTSPLGWIAGLRRQCTILKIVAALLL